MFGPNPPDSASATECTPGKDFPDFSKVGAASLQMDRSRSSGGVGWSNGYWGIVTSKRTPRLAHLEVRRKSLNMISSLCFFYFVFLLQGSAHLLKSSDIYNDFFLRWMMRII